MANALVKHTENAQPAPLKAVEGRHIPKGLAEIKALMSSERHTPEHVYTKVLSEQERTIVCFAAGLKRHDLEKGFANFNADTRLKIHKAILQLQELVKAFVDANAMAPAKFLQNAPAESAKTSYSHLTVSSH
ncbi:MULTISPECIES: hypothetical protein [Pseudoalteromonas]|uniref:hypothetical protein n=1 Tax=Pseudoalteromonas TaxID=53246 RepID=UPI0002CA6E33|nr:MULTISPECIES: hypothetical protein [Pseudoalteromonas]ENN98989.1 hypothetical protein J139_09453 [Pseudoalteromonas agarivorans S816]TMS65656.1 hypothetical protein CWB83_12535 [Pseudoalteromonas sp. S1691]TMS66013.1 hypothetical protein CWB86_18580 [Pseudoalteromonas sp. S1731]TMS71132.1 hypothetical protein CWB88_17165 [Pseudoalteromonas sp. S1941]TMS76168.1 hypothetical protein CWB82_17750 [Pseudoalteromonas sp. S1690]